MKTFLLYFFLLTILVVSNTTFFDTGNPVLLRPSYTELKCVAAILRANLSLQVKIGGHTDNVGSVSLNQTLLQNRANAVLYYLQDQVPEATKLRQKVMDTLNQYRITTETGKQSNRRVEFRIIRK